jgi:hypothetical protein
MEKLGYKMSINTVLKTLSEAKQSLVIYLKGPKEQSKVVPVFSEIPKPAEEYLAKYGLKKYALR